MSGDAGCSREVIRLAAEVERRDGIDLRLRVGLNSGQVIAGAIGSAALGYTATGEQVGMAQRMESVAPAARKSAGMDSLISSVTNAQSALGLALVYRDNAGDRDRGHHLLTEVGEVFVRRRHNLSDLPMINGYLAREIYRRGDRDDATSLMRATADHLFRDGHLLAWGVPATGVLVEALLDRGTDADIAEAEAAIERLAAAPADDGLVVRDILLLRLRALLAQTRGDAAAYVDLRDRYRGMAKHLGFEGHVALADAMP